jgi:two-component system nitrogen regulation response regulator GlnG
MRTTILVIDTDPLTHQVVRQLLPDAEVQLLTATSASAGLRLARTRTPDVIILAFELPDLPGFELVRHLREIDPGIPIVFVMGDGNADGAIRAMTQGAYDCLSKPLSVDQARDVVAGAARISKCMRVPAVVEYERELEDSHVIIGRSAAMQEVYKAVGRAAPQDINVLILGGSGTGKELIARVIYNHSRRAAAPFLAINCAAIPETLLESELFGHEKGAFTGADRQRIGKFEQCNRGTIFLDEVGDMAPLTQAKILRVIQEKSFERVGGNTTIQTDVRILAATNRDLERMVAKGQFRADLYYRLSVFSVYLPALRKRMGDLPLLVDFYLKRFCRELDRRACRAHPDTLELLQSYSWPGNVRELQSVLKQALLRSSGQILLPEFLPAFLAAGGVKGKAKGSNGEGSRPFLDRFIHERINSGMAALYDDFRKETDYFLLKKVMRYTGGNQLQAARILGIPRSKLRNRLRALGLPTEHTKWKELAAEGSLQIGPKEQMN